MFMGPLDADAAWSTNGLDGARRFLDRVWRLIINQEDHGGGDFVAADKSPLTKIYHETIKKVTTDFENLHFNTAISQLMVFVNEAYKEDTVPTEFIKGFIKVLSPIAPHISEELWSRLGHSDTISYEAWPTYDEAYQIGRASCRGRQSRERDGVGPRGDA